MKALLRWLRLPVLVMLAAIIFTECSDPEEDVAPPQEEEEEVTPETADAFLDSFRFTASTKVVGTMPTVTNTSLVKSDVQDTLYMLPEMETPIRISHPESVVIGGWYVGVKNSTYYYEVPIDLEEESDTVSVIMVSIDPKELDLPHSVPLEITPYDQNKVPVDIITRTLTVEEPASPSRECDIRVDGDTLTSGDEWRWYSTTAFDTQNKLVFFNAPYTIFKAKQTISGCCAEQPVCPQAVFNPVTGATDLVYDSEVTAETFYQIQYEAFTFYTNGTFKRNTYERIKNFSYENTDWCQFNPGYNDRRSDVYYYGTHDYQPGNTTISYATDRLQCDDENGICGYGSRPGEIVHSCNVMAIVADRLMIEGRKEVRLYLRQPDNYAWTE